MLQDILLISAAAAPAAGGSATNAEALQQMGFNHMIQNFDAVGYTVFIILCIMSVGSWWYTIVNLIKNTVRRQSRRHGRAYVLGNPERAGRDPLHGRAAAPTSRSPRSRSIAPRPPRTTSAMKAAAWSKP